MAEAHSDGLNAIPNSGFSTVSSNLFYETSPVAYGKSLTRLFNGSERSVGQIAVDLSWRQGLNERVADLSNYLGARFSSHIPYS